MILGAEFDVQLLDFFVSYVNFSPNFLTPYSAKQFVQLIQTFWLTLNSQTKIYLIPQNALKGILCTIKDSSRYY